MEKDMIDFTALDESHIPLMRRWLSSGAGTGFLSRFLAERCTRVIACDRSKEMLDYANAQYESEGIANVDFRISDHLSADPCEKADLVVSAWSLPSTITENWEADWRERFGEVIEHALNFLKPDGAFAVLETANICKAFISGR